MLEVEDLSRTQIDDLIERVKYGHLACCLNDKPYVVPVHYAVEDGKIYIYTTEGKKAEILAENPNVCLQVEEVIDNQNWSSAIVEGAVVELDNGPARDHAVKLILQVNPTLTPAVAVRWMDIWVRENVEVVYALEPTAASGRRAAAKRSSPGVVPQTDSKRRDLM